MTFRLAYRHAGEPVTEEYPTLRDAKRRVPYLRATGRHPRLERFDGQRWKRVRAPRPTPRRTP